MLDVSVVIPNLNRAGLLKRALDSVAAQTEAPAAVVVVDNGSTDGSVESAKRFGAQVIRFQTNQGFARAVNEAAHGCKARYIMVLNNDAVLAPECLARLYEAAERSEAAFAAPMVVSEADPNTLDGAWDLLSLGGCALRVGHGLPLAEPFLSPRIVRFAPFTAVLVRTSMFQSLGGLNEELGTYMEDVEFGLRCALAGGKGVYEPLARATHRGSATDGVWSARMVHRIARNQLLITAMHWPKPMGFRLAWTVFVGQSLWGLSALRHGRAFDWLRGKREAVALYRQLRSRPRSSSPEALLPLLRECDARIRSTAKGVYWRLYSLLTPSGGA